MTKIAMIGAGSTVFMKNILTDILLEPPFKDCEVALQDIDAKRLKTSKESDANKYLKGSGIGETSNFCLLQAAFGVSEVSRPASEFYTMAHI